MQDPHSLGHYHEARLTVAHPPLDLAVSLVLALAPTRYVLYEMRDCIRIALGAAWNLDIDQAGTVRCGGRRVEPRQTLADTLTAAVADVPVPEWRAYGRASFELAYLAQGLALPKAPGPLLRLSIPTSEIVIHDRDVLLRSLDERDLARLVDDVSHLDRRAELVPPSRPLQPGNLDHGHESFMAGVADAVSEMRARAYDKVILSRDVPIPSEVDLPLSYHAGRLRNTPARSFLLRDDDLEAYGFSPETLLELDGGRISTQPLAGTRALSGRPEEDTRLREDLLYDAKEIAEHAVSVRLAMQEMEPLCAPDTMGVSEFMAIKQRGSVQHLGSLVRGRLAGGLGPWHAFLRLFPAVTASGIPKIAALDSIRRHETSVRGLYSGCVFMTDGSGAMDAALVLRSVYRTGSRCWLQAGAGVVPLSSPEREFEETSEKLASVARHLRRR
ncbi:hypothetical protein VQ03_18015 [Methylobacterium tarhaniae]|uniref:Chorismate-utilising enzyme C-terminal domain-containing protein n=2 Tax=Methylobacterium tarhaniae TaxID=1187852 RepID=A0A0J6SX03_9HYPH|nr:hypothetical protein VQ03_18015 [Methylobacterium tarhaniae]